MAGFNRGAKSIEHEEQQRAAAISGKANRLDYFKVDKGDTVYVRFLTDGDDDGWIKVAQHNYARCKPAPEGVKSWPKGLTGVCRYDGQIREILGTSDCYICDNEVPSGSREEFAKPTNRVWALAVLRHRVIGDGSEELGGPDFDGKFLGYDDVWEEYTVLDAKGEPTNEKAERPKIVIVNMAWNNFFQPLSSMYQMYGTVCDRDFAIKRTGDGRDTAYSIMPLDKTEGLEPGSQSWKERYTDQLEQRDITLEKIVLDLASDEHYARFFDATKAVDKDGKISAVIPGSAAKVFTGEADKESEDAVAPEDSEKLAALKERLAGRRS